jgi:uncharacterized protein YndB with AHSA1/START domain
LRIPRTRDILTDNQETRMSTSDRIEKEVLLRAPRARVWQAIGDSSEFGTWFHCRFAGPFEAGTELQVTLTEAGYEGTEFVIFVERVEPQRHLSFRWHPYGMEWDGDISDQPTTLVTFDLEDAPEGTLLRIVGSGFDALPGDHGPRSRERNAGGWEIQGQRVADHVHGTD